MKSEASRHTASKPIHIYSLWVGQNGTYRNVPAIKACFDAFKAAYQTALRKLPGEREAVAYLKDMSNRFPNQSPGTVVVTGKPMQLVCVRECCRN